MALREATKEAIYLYNMLSSIKELLKGNTGIITDKIPILEDNNGAKKLSENPEFHKRTKHIDIAYHFTREAIENQYIQVCRVATKQQLADSLTKTVPLPAFEIFKQGINLT